MKRKLQQLTEKKRKSQQLDTEKQGKRRIWLWILLFFGGMLVGGIIVIALFVWMLSSLPF